MSGSLTPDTKLKLFISVQTNKMQPVSLEADDEYFQNVKNYLGPEITSHVNFSDDLREVSKKYPNLEITQFQF